MIRSAPLATHRLWVWGSIAGLVLMALYFSLPRQMPSPTALRKAVHKTDDEKCMAAAGNRTLGFESIQYLNLPHRTDRNDAMMLQAYISGIDLQYFPGVYEDDIKEVGLPPSSKKTKSKMRVVACYRAHANVRLSLAARSPPTSPPSRLYVRGWCSSSFRLPPSTQPSSAVPPACSLTEMLTRFYLPHRFGPRCYKTGCRPCS